ncbi:hypothetical protein [Actinoplanes teichomyceticus]|uniref:Uncharacterized protein n=1 Tax=Actinoplanes teichomyceticus TaxID=1867 RepID=A0A561WIA4_ACTTI|nr:hypothetical protein [Actinoplanes teichomyceticus]TWG23584.1 hypothetical protein FHX34_102133 [Actinoplanes teichomyceticus]GIF16211.1 hypothetical protein Ate01nite_62430 [Actinoplanes teichomyceticus]
MRRRDAAPLNADGVPAWLPVFEPSRWTDPADRPPADWGFGSAMWRAIRGHERWADAGREWLAERGRRAEWYALTRPRVVAR